MTINVAAQNKLYDLFYSILMARFAIVQSKSLVR